MNDEEFLNKSIKKAYKKNKDFWGFDIDYKVKIVKSRTEMNKEWGEKTEKWMVAFAWDKTLTIFGASVYEKYGVHKLESYQDTVTHELNHLFYQKFVGSYKPLWIGEGLAMNIQKDKNIRIEKVDPKYLTYTGKEVKDGLKIYPNSALAVKILLKKIGKKKLLSLLKEYSKSKTKENYQKVFGEYLKLFQK